MKASIIQIGNSKGVRLTKDMLLLSGIQNDVEVKVKRGEIKIVPLQAEKVVNNFALASEESFAKDWLRPEEEEAWKIYQSGK